MTSPLISQHSLPYHCHHFQGIIDQYLVRRGPTFELFDVDDEKYFAFKDPNVKILKPTVCLYEFMSKEDLKEFLTIEDDHDIKRKIGKPN